MPVFRDLRPDESWKVCRRSRLTNGWYLVRDSVIEQHMPRTVRFSLLGYLVDRLMIIGPIVWPCDLMSVKDNPPVRAYCVRFIDILVPFFRMMVNVTEDGVIGICPSGTRNGRQWSPSLWSLNAEETWWSSQTSRCNQHTLAIRPPRMGARFWNGHEKPQRNSRNCG